MSILRKFDEIKGAKFITIKGYESSTSGEVANHTINVNVSVENAKKADLEYLKSITESQLGLIAESFNAPFELAEKALNELIVSAERNLSKDNRTNQSVGQTDAFVQLGKGLKIHKDTMEVYVSGFANNKHVIVEGVYPTSNKQLKTLIKDEIRKGFKMRKFRTFKIGHADSISVSGSTVMAMTSKLPTVNL
jgi:hypothetical protein